MKTNTTQFGLSMRLLPVMLLASTFSFAHTAHATLLTANAGGTFTMSMDRNALALSSGGNASNPGHFLVQYFDTSASDYTTRTDSSFYYNNPTRTEISALNLVHDITAISATDPAGQMSGRYVKSTTTDFAVDTNNLTATGLIGMTGIEMYRGVYNGTVLYGDYSLGYDPAYRQTMWDAFGLAGTPGGWYLQNNVSFSAAVYELNNLTLQFSSATDWKLSGDLLLSPENGFLLKTASLVDVGDFCLGFGSYSGCGQVSAVPLPASAWLFVSGLSGLGFNRYRRKGSSS